MSNKYTFMDLLDGKVQLPDSTNFAPTKIEIPIIQRDYVQGQKEGDALNKTGKRFVQGIFQSLQNNSQMDLDFIYGSVENGKFVPLDGQQRLTTLFLLHWYFACKCLLGEKLEGILKKLSVFSYETRISSRDFCSNLCKLKLKIDKEKKPSEFIKNESWFFNKFKQDPTVSSMLNVLDTVHELDKNANITFEKLTLLKFQILPLTQFGLTEELYLKMNARGKLLTDFEKFKAEIESKAEKENWEKDISLEDRFSFKADREWTDLFWDKFKTSMDSAFLNFIAEYMIIYLAKNIKNPESDEEKRKLIQRIHGNPEELSVDDFDGKSFNELKNILNIYSKDSSKVKVTNVSLWNFAKNDETLFDSVCKKGTTYPTKALFYAQTLYLKKATFDQDRFNDWMRVLRNIANNSTVDDVQPFGGFLNLIDELSDGCDDICKYLSQNEVKSKFAENQVKEEIFKAKNIMSNTNIKSLIIQLEENNFCKGRIYFAIYCTGIELYENPEEKISQNLLLKIKNVFDSEFDKNNISNDFRVLLFTCGNNKFYEYWWSWSYGTETHKHCCIESQGDLILNFSRKENSKFRKDILKEAVEKIANSNSSIEKILFEYECPAEMPAWEKWIIKNPKEFEKHCSGHYIGITSDGKNCYLYEWRKRPNSRKDCFKVPN